MVMATTVTYYYTLSYTSSQQLIIVQAQSDVKITVCISYLDNRKFHTIK